jgi:polyhydroxyalkanoate synthesis repressor PhaR
MLQTQHGRQRVMQAMKPITTNEPTRIRRYPNRRFYDSTRHSYITLGDMEQLIQEGQTIEVRDSRSDEDLTRQILTQILLERHPEKIDIFPAALLQGLIRANELALDLWRSYLRYALQVLERFQHPTSTVGLSLPWLSAFLPDSARAVHAADDRVTPASRLAALEPIAGSTRDTEADAGTDILDGLESRIRKLEGGSSH